MIGVLIVGAGVVTAGYQALKRWIEKTLAEIEHDVATMSDDDFIEKHGFPKEEAGEPDHG